MRNNFTVYILAVTETGMIKNTFIYFMNFHFISIFLKEVQYIFCRRKYYNMTEQNVYYLKQ